MEQNGSVRYGILAALVAALGGYMFGFEMAIIAGPLIFVERCFALTTWQSEFLVSSFLVGAIIGAAVSGACSDFWGRRKVLTVSAILFLASSVVCTIPRDVTELMVGRFLAGLGVGVVSLLSPMYIAEISPAKIRGRLVVLNQLALVIGILCAYLVSYALADAGPNNWRYMFATGALPSLVFSIAMVGMPESPRWLAKQGRHGEAFDILARIGGREQAQRELLEIEEAIVRESSSFWDLFRPGMRLAVLIGMVMPLIDQSTGINVVVNYAPKIFQKAGQSDVAALLATVPVGVTNIIGTIIAMAVIDKLGRKPLALIGLSGMFVSLVSLGLVFQSEETSGWLVAALMISFIAFYSISLGCVVLLLAAEIFPTKVRGRAMSLSLVSLWVWCAVVSMTFLSLTEAITIAGSFWLYAAMCVFAWVFIWKVVPETKGKTLEDIELLWNAPKHQDSPTGVTKEDHPARLPSNHSLAARFLDGQ
jgi:MFS transporter, SP family, arabinose:H+ symporter